MFRVDYISRKETKVWDVSSPTDGDELPENHKPRCTSGEVINSRSGSSTASPVRPAPRYRTYRVVVENWNSYIYIAISVKHQLALKLIEYVHFSH